MKMNLFVADLPELPVLRHMFTKRYGKFIWPFVSSEVLKLLFLLMCLSCSLI
jgi:hypothetical protein